MTDRNGNPGRPAGTVLTALATSALAALAVVALVGVLLLVFGQRPGSGIGASGQATETAADPGLTPSPATPSPSLPTSDKTGGAEVTRTVGARVPGDSKVVVLNATSRSGLAGQFQRALEAKGWDVVAVGNFRGNVPATTVYYPSGQRGAAEALEAQFDEVTRVRQAFSGISQTRLTVILTSDLPP
jgi:hypothetical protein